MWKAMEGWGPEVFMPSTPAGVHRVLQTNLTHNKFAYILESTMNEFYRRRNCDLVQIGGSLDSSGYALAFPKGSPLVRNFSLAILNLQNSQLIQRVYDRWWKELLGGLQTACDEQVDTDKTLEGLKQENIGGVFLVLVGGLLASAVMCAAERLCKFQMQPVIRVLLCTMHYAHLSSTVYVYVLCAPAYVHIWLYVCGAARAHRSERARRGGPEAQREGGGRRDGALQGNHVARPAQRERLLDSRALALLQNAAVQRPSLQLERPLAQALVRTGPGRPRLSAALCAALHTDAHSRCCRRRAGRLRALAMRSHTHLNPSPLSFLCDLSISTELVRIDFCSFIISIHTIFHALIRYLLQVAIHFYAASFKSPF